MTWDTENELDDYSGWDDQPPLTPPLRLEPAHRIALFAAVDAGLQEHGCDNTLRAAQQWAAGAGVAWSALRAQLEQRGGYCDCEILFNVLQSDPVERDEPAPG